MHIYNFNKVSDLEDYMSQKLLEEFIPITPSIATYLNYLDRMYSASSMDMSFFNDFNNEHADKHVFDSVQDLDQAFVNRIKEQSHPCLMYLDIESFRTFRANYMYIGNKDYLKKEVFFDLIPSTQSILLDNFMNYTFKFCSWMMFNFTPEFSDTTFKAYQEYSDLSNNLSTMKSVISKLQEDHKFYSKSLTDTQLQIIELQRQNEDLQQQLNIKSITTWG